MDTNDDDDDDDDNNNNNNNGIGKSTQMSKSMQIGQTSYCVINIKVRLP
jgi:hypothetical protein